MIQVDRFEIDPRPIRQVLGYDGAEGYFARRNGGSWFFDELTFHDAVHHESKGINATLSRLYLDTSKMLEEKFEIRDLSLAEDRSLMAWVTYCVKLFNRNKEDQDAGIIGPRSTMMVSREAIFHWITDNYVPEFATSGDGELWADAGYVHETFLDFLFVVRDRAFDFHKRNDNNTLEPTAESSGSA